jgi:hypothetical protein
MCEQRSTSIPIRPEGLNLREVMPMSNEMKSTKYIVLDYIRGVLKRLKTNKKIPVRDMIMDMINVRSYSWIDFDCLMLINYCDEKANFTNMKSFRKEFGPCNVKFIAHSCVCEAIFNDPFIQFLLEELENKIISPEQAKKIIGRIHNEINKTKRD